MALFMTMVVGAVFGTPAGMIVGTIVGHFKAPSMPKAPDAAPEGWQPYRWGLLLPLLALAVLVPLYIWLIMKILNG